MPRAPKALVWLSDEIEVPPFSKEAGAEAGALLTRLSQGESLSMPLSRPLPIVGPGCHELRIRDADVAWRIVYHLAATEVVILELFPKRSRATPDRVIRSCRQRLARYRVAAQGGAGS